MKLKLYYPVYYKACHWLPFCASPYPLIVLNIHCNIILPSMLSPK